MSYTVSYNANGATTGGNLPPNQTYAVGAQVTVAGAPSGYARNSDEFARWNTNADGSGTEYDGGNTFNMPANSVVLYAQWYMNEGLIDSGSGPGVTTHYKFKYESGLASAGIEPARTNAILKKFAVGSETPQCYVERDYAWMSGIFNIDITAAMGMPYQTYAENLGGGASWGPPLRLKGGNGDGNYLRYLMVSEVTEMFMFVQNKGWFAPDGSNEQSCGEALSRYLAYKFLETQGLPAQNGYATASLWLNSSLSPGTAGSTQTGGNIAKLLTAIDATTTALTVDSVPGYPFETAYIIQIDSETMLVTSTDSTNKTLAVTRGYNGTTASSHSSQALIYLNFGARFDYVNVTIEYDHEPDPAIGCGVLFLYYLDTQLGFLASEIAQAAPGVSEASKCLRDIYTNLTGDSSDPFLFFSYLLSQTYPPNNYSTIPGPNADNPFPLGSLTVWGAKDTWGKDEVGDIIKSGGIYPNAFWLMLEGFSSQMVDDIRPTIPTIGFPGVIAIPTPDSPTDPDNIIYETANAKVPQRIRFGYNVNFDPTTTLPAFPSSGEKIAYVNSTITLLGQPFSTNADFFFVAGADPYFTNVITTPNPADENAAWLSADLRVFTACPGISGPFYRPVAGEKAPIFAVDSSSGAYTYISSLIPWLNSNFGNPGNVDPFEANSQVVPDQQKALNSDGSVTPYTVQNGIKYANYNFALARVRLRGTPGSSGQAQGVKVFFRLWNTQTADTNWDPTSTYLSSLDSANLPAWPLVPSDHHTLPFFATGANPDFSDPSNAEFGTAGVNNQTIQIQVGNQDDTQWAYFGCFLDVYNSTLTFNGVPVQHLLTGNHHCLVAQIAYDDAPIASISNVIISPENSDKLAQRNLQITPSDNPGPAAAHRVPQTFDTRLSSTQEISPDLPDELMIDWGDVPVGSVASIYWPQLLAVDVVQLANTLYGTHVLSQSDTNTIQCKTVKGASYIPIPFSSDRRGTPRLGGLIYIDLPPKAVTKGEEYNVIVRRVRIRLVGPDRRRRPEENRSPVIPQIHAASSHQARGGSLRAPETRTKRTTVLTPRSERDDANGFFVVRTEITPTHAPEFPEKAVQPPIRPIPQTMRSIVGSFNVRIPVGTAEDILPGEENLLAVLKARLQVMAPSDRWYPVLKRYIGFVSGRVDGLGGSASSIPPSFGGAPIPPAPPAGGKGGDVNCHTGRVCGIIFDKSGDFDGFVLDVEQHHIQRIRPQHSPQVQWVEFHHKEYRFRTREKGLLRIVDIAGKQRSKVTVICYEGTDVIDEIVIHERLAEEE